MILQVVSASDRVIVLVIFDVLVTVLEQSNSSRGIRNSSNTSSCMSSNIILPFEEQNNIKCT